MIHFAPKYPDTFMFTTLDGHGCLPNLNEEIKFEQTLITGSYKLNKEGNDFKKFNYGKVSDELLPWLPEYGTALQLDNYLPNADILIDARVIAARGVANIDLGIITEYLN